MSIKWLHRSVVVFALALSNAAMAQTPPPIWSGPYSGVTLGFGGADLVTSTDESRSEGSEVAIFGGFNWLRGNLMFGTEADLTVNVFGDTVYGDRVPVGPTTAAVDWITTFRGRLGWATPDTMLYTTAGLSYSDTVSNGRSYVLGYVVGVGFEQRLQRRWSLRGEAMFHYFDTENATPTQAAVDRVYSVRLGLLRHF